MKNLVVLKKGKMFCSSLDISKEFNITHNHVLEKIRDLTNDLATVKKEFLESKFTNERNREYFAYDITRRGYMSLMMNLDARSKESKILLMQKKELFIDAFEAMEKIITKETYNKNNVEWLKTREQGKAIRLKMTDTVKKFVEYATTQGSTKANMYYMNITKMEYKALDFMEQSKPKLRETLNLMETHQLIITEDRVKKLLEKLMIEKLHYKEIYLLVKQDIENFAGVLRLK